MPRWLADKLVVANSSRALFDLATSNRIFDTADTAAAHQRLMGTLRASAVRLGECPVLAALNQAAFLKALVTDIFFDDQPSHHVLASVQVMARQIPHGISDAVPRDRVRGSGS